MQKPSCEICFEKYNDGANTPVVMICGHSFCRGCVNEKNKKEKFFECVCGHKEECAVLMNRKNFAILNMFQHDYSDYLKCKNHGKKIQWYCHSDGCDLCSKCIIDHKFHDFEEKLQEKNLKLANRVAEQEKKVGYDKNNHFITDGPDINLEKNQKKVVPEGKKYILKFNDIPEVKFKLNKQKEYMDPYKRHINQVKTLLNSNIIPNKLLEKNKNILLPKNAVPEKCKLLYSINNNGASNNTFHELCDNKGPTLTVVGLKNNRIFGGFTFVPWIKSYRSGQYALDGKAYLFFLADSEGCQLPIKNDISMAVLNNHIYGPTFGAGYDLHINFDDIQRSCSSLETYLIQTFSRNKRSTLAGSYNNWDVKDIEIYRIEF